MAKWIKVVERDELSEGQMMLVQPESNPLPLILVLNKGQLYAFNSFCPHASANLIEGYLRPNYIICPLHAYRFELTSGSCLKPRDGPRLRVYQAEWRGNEAWVKIEG